MYVQWNAGAAFAQRQLALNATRVGNVLEHLSSGYRINHAADDAAGLAISRKLEMQVRGLSQATRNIQDGISLLQTAEGGLDESQLLLQRARVLAVQAANDSNTADDRQLIQIEVDRILHELDRLSTCVEFNQRKLLCSDTHTVTRTATRSEQQISTVASGSVSSAILLVGSTGGADIFQQASNLAANRLYNTLLDKGFTKEEIYYLNPTLAQDVDGNGQQDDIDILSTVANTRQAIENWAVAHANSNSSLFLYLADHGNVDQFWANSGEVIGAAAMDTWLDNLQAATGTKIVYVQESCESGSFLDNIKGTGRIGLASTNASTLSWAWNGPPPYCWFSEPFIDKLAEGTDLKTAFDYAVSRVAVFNAILGQNQTPIMDDNGDGAYTGADGSAAAAFTVSPYRVTTVEETVQVEYQETVVEQSTPGLTIHAGANAGQTMALELADVSTGALGLTGLSVLDQSGAEAAIGKLDEAIAAVTAARARIGAQQNRLESSLRFAGNAGEQQTAALSRVVDQDMAAGIIALTKSQVLVQASTAMLAQANFSRNNILQLLAA